MSAVGYSRVFTLEVDGRPIFAFEAVTARGAQQLAKERWLLDDLMILTSGGAPSGLAIQALRAAGDGRRSGGVRKRCERGKVIG